MLTTDSDPALKMARQALYRFSSLCLLDPRADTWRQLNGLVDSSLLPDAAEIIRNKAAVWPRDLGLGESPAAELNPANVLGALPETPGELNRQFEAVFGLLVSSACPPYETEYIHAKYSVQRAHTLADINGFYKAFRLKASSAYPERPDHIVLQTEFMAFLIGLEVAGPEADDGAHQHMDIGRQAQAKFFREHLSWWAPAFSHLLAREAGDTFYGRIARFLSALLTAERIGFGLPKPQREAQPSLLERSEACDGCGLVAS